MICDWLGSIPKQIGLLTALERCDLSSNRLSGCVWHHHWRSNFIYYDWFRSDPKGNRWLTVVANTVAPRQPTERWKLDSTSGVYGSQILIGSGRIPKEIGNLQSLQVLLFNANQLEGEKGRHQQWCPYLLHSDWCRSNPKGDWKFEVVTNHFFESQPIER
jgi:hypothetical protein